MIALPIPSFGEPPDIHIAPDAFQVYSSYHVSASLHTWNRFHGHSRLRPNVPFIGIDLEQLNDREVIASFAGIAMSGRNEVDAIDALFEVLLDALEIYLAEEASLGPEPKRQLSILRQHFACDG